jgi:hypothetical protein
MAATASPNGFRPQGNVISAAYNSKTRLFGITSGYATNIGYGDPVIPVTAGTIQRDPMTTALTAPGCLGIFMGCSYTDPNTLQKIFKQYWPASTVASDAVAYVFDDPEGVFQIQADATLAQTALFANAALVSTAPSTTTGNSKVALQASSINSTTTLPVRIIGFVNSPTSAVGDAFTDVFVRFNFGIHTYHNATGLA